MPSAKGEPASDNSAESAGAAYVLERQDGAWLQRVLLKPSEPKAFDRFGSTVSLSGDTLAVGAMGLSPTMASGAVYIFVRNGANWDQQAYLPALVNDANFGRAISVSNDTLVVGAPYEQTGGVAHVFVRSGVTWTEQALLKPSALRSSRAFGGAVAISGDTLVVADSFDASPGNGVDPDPSVGSPQPYSGAVYLFRREAGVWSQQSFVKAPSIPGNPDALAYTEFGTTVALSNDTLAVGVPGDSTLASGINGVVQGIGVAYAGAVHIYERDTNQTWTHQAFVKSSTPHFRDRFGASLAIDGDNVAIGAPDALDASGRVQVVHRDAGVWTVRGYFRGVDQQEHYGSAVALSGSLLSVGAPDNSRAGNEDDPCDSSEPSSGAVYVGRF
jgi:hypothetical protein